MRIAAIVAIPPHAGAGTQSFDEIDVWFLNWWSGSLSLELSGHIDVQTGANITGNLTNVIAGGRPRPHARREQRRQRARRRYRRNVRR